MTMTYRERLEVMRKVDAAMFRIDRYKCSLLQQPKLAYFNFGTQRVVDLEEPLSPVAEVLLKAAFLEHGRYLKEQYIAACKEAEVDPEEKVLATM